jgi:adenine C2-methylase RlmN of 23S rRNA A2503 and tRNA A37
VQEASANHLFAVPLADGTAVEAVFYPTGTLCLSTQVGCALGCPYCASGARGLTRNLTAEELWQQVAAARARGPDFEAFWDTLAAVWPRLSRARRRKVGVNLLLVDGINDSEAEVLALAGRLAPHPEVTVHLLVPNPVPGSPFRALPAERVQRLWAVLRARGVHARRANPWRRQQRGGCGTLVATGAETGTESAEGRCVPLA